MCQDGSSFTWHQHVTTQQRCTYTTSMYIQMHYKGYSHTFRSTYDKSAMSLPYKSGHKDKLPTNMQSINLNNFRNNKITGTLLFDGLFESKHDAGNFLPHVLLLQRHLQHLLPQLLNALGNTQQSHSGPHIVQCNSHVHAATCPAPQFFFFLL